MTRWFLPLASAVAVGGFSLFWQWPSPGDTRNVQTDTPAPTPRGSGTDIVNLYSQSEAVARPSGANNSAPAGQTSSAGHVALSAFQKDDNVRIELDIEEHWHINANPASFDFLLPTEVDIVADGTRLPATLDYPAGAEIDVGLDDPIRVYSGQVGLVANLVDRDNDRPLKAQARIQACNDSGLCLAPSTLSATIAGSAPSSSR